MPDLKFDIISAEIKQFAAIPTLSFRLKITNEVSDEEVYAAALRCQVIIEAVKRKYNDDTKENLLELFGEAARWGETLGSLFWMIINVPVARFTGNTVIDIAIPCSEDQTLAAGKYFHAVRDENIPLAFLFSGTLFYKGAGEQVQATQISWEKETTYKMPAILWQQMMEIYFPNYRWVRIQKDVYDRLVQYKAQSAFPTLEKCLESLLEVSMQESMLPEKQSL